MATVTTDHLGVDPVPEDAHDSFRPSTAGWVARLALPVLIIAAMVFLVPLLDEDKSGYAVDAVIFAVIGLSLNILIGYTGQLSLGHQGFVGVGAFAAAYAATDRGVPFAATFPIAMLAGAFFALILGAIALRITGLYLALITLVFGRTLEESLFLNDELTQGGAGQPANRPDFLLDNGKYYLFCLAFLAVIWYLDWRLTKTKTGRALFALRENERAAAAFGVNVTAYKLLGFVLSGAIAGLGGALFAFRSGVANGSDFDFFLALTFVLMVVVGGLNSRVGVVAGSFFFALLPVFLEKWGTLHHFIQNVFGQYSQFAPQFIGAALLLNTLIFNPGGIAQQLRPFTDWVSGKRFSLHHHGDGGPAAVEGSNVRA